ncbi:hypothetical protein MMC11_002860 [Xylographa trunciseda]|nr:hypothetical protein [Xylographa trunciseda]
MSGRSAHVRARKNKSAEESLRSQHNHAYSQYDNLVYGMSGPPLARPSRPANLSLVSADTSVIHRRHSVSSGSSSYNYAMSPRRSRPIVLPTAIEKSDFRTHFDGMSKSIRGKLGSFIKGGDDHAQQTRIATQYDNSNNTSRSTDFTPSVTAIPSLNPITPPEEVHGLGITSPTSQPRPRHREQGFTMPIRRFEGGGKGPQTGWKLLSNNPELWDDNGDTYVYMYVRGSKTKPPPSFRINSSVVYQLGSKTFIGELLSESVPPGWPRFYPSDMSSPEDTESTEDTVDSMDLPRHTLPHSGAYLDTDDKDYRRRSDRYKNRRATKTDDGILHEIYVSWPGVEAAVHSTLWHITTRNFFAVACDADSLIGTTLFECLTRLWERVQAYPDYLDDGADKVKFITDYVLRHKFDDVRNQPSYAASILAFSELPAIQWREGYVEAFVHCVGMLNTGLKTVPEWRLILPHTKMFIENASLEMEERVHRAQCWLFSFDFTEMWPTTSAPPSVGRAAFDRFRKWLCKYYENVFLHWPPTPNDSTWLTHDRVVRLRKDFYGLYDYLVDRDIVFDGTEYRPGQKWAITGKSGQTFRADTADLAFTDILLGFDARNDFPHIPHPYPRTPHSAPVMVKPKSTFHLKKPATPAEISAQSRRKALSYSEATNVYILRNQYIHSDLVSNFIAFEQSDFIESTDPFEARRGRWLLIYGILQVLATVAVDSPNLRYSETVNYHLSPQMKGVVPWSEAGSPPEEEACHTRSHCWRIPKTWAPSAPKAKPGSHKPIIWGQFGDGRSRADESEDKGLVIKVRETTSTSIGRLRAEEWVHNTTANQTDFASDTGGPIASIGYGGKTEDRKDSALSSAEGLTGSSTADSSDSAAVAARRRRAHIHGFTDFQVPPEW